jgi:iron complex outermembrane receptor protein
MTKSRLMFACTVAAICFGTGAQGAPETTTSEDESNERGAAIPEIVVTATKRDTKLEETPIAITALTAETIEQQRLYNLSDIALTTPGLIFTPHSKQESYLSIRGTNQDNGAAGADQGVSVFIDDVPTTGVGDNNPDLFDLQSIEVLRGPQGTLFGRNVTGGAVVIHTLPPSFQPEIKAQATYGNYNLGEFRAYATGPLVSNVLAGKVTFEVRRQDGLIDNRFLDTKDFSTKVWAGRAQLLYVPDDDLRVLLGVDYTHDTSPYKVQQLAGNFQPSLFPHLYYGANDTNQASPSKGNSKTGGAVARADYTTAIGTFTSITGYRYVKALTNFSTTADPYNELLQLETQRDDQITEELRFASTSSAKFKWVGGLFYLNTKRRYREDLGVHVFPGVAASFSDPFTNPSYVSVNDQHVYGNSYALFGEGSYPLTTTVKLTLGTRYTVETKSGHSEVFDTSGLTPPLLAPHYSHTWNAFTPKAVLDYQPNEHFLGYLSAITGFKSGGFDVNGATSDSLATPFKPEKVISYEAGIKVSAFDRRLVVNLAGYEARYSDLQTNEYVPALLNYITGNAGKANIPGVELEVVANPVRWLTLNGSYAYMDANYTRYVPDSSTDFSGHQIPFDAKHQYHFGTEIHTVVPPLGGGSIRIGGDVTFQSRRYFNSENTYFSFIDDHTTIRGLVNLHATWASADSKWEVSAWGKNVTNTRTIIFANDLTAYYATPAEIGNPNNKIYDVGWTAPPTFGVTVTLRQ